MLVPKLLEIELRKKSILRSKVRIGFFLHTPFPSVDVFNTLRVCKDILSSLLRCDLVGFHTEEYAKNFLDCCSKILSVTPLAHCVSFQDNATKVRALPIGINCDRFVQALQQNFVKESVTRLKAVYKDQKIILGVDRLDFIKGIPLKLRAFELFLSIHPEWLGQVCLVQIVVPSRELLQENQDLKVDIDLLAERIDDKYRSGDMMPVHLMHRNVSFDELIAFYFAADVCIVSSIRDGMNLVSHEYVASQHQSQGVLILSEFTGAAKTLPGTVSINPCNISEFAEAYSSALSMDTEERARRWLAMYDHISHNTR